MMMNNETYMLRALELARISAEEGEVPVGAVIVKNSSGTSVNNPLFIPTVCHYPANFYNNKVYLLKDYTEELAASHAVRTYYNNPISLASLKKYVTDTVDGEFLPDYMK